MWFWLAVACLAAQLVMLGMLVAGARALRDFAVAPRQPERRWPAVSIVVAARDEAAGIEAAMRSLLALDYPVLEVIAVDDRSTDATAEILDRLAALDPRLKVHHVRELPKGWLGKNHALALGGRKASGELILFTDADVEFAPGALRAAVAILEEERLDHLALAPRLRLPGAWLAACVAYFGRQFYVFLRPWRAREPRSSAYIGVGAFNLLRASAYRTIGGHARIALRPDDDVKLGKLVKLAGLRQDLRHAPDALCVTWYSTVREFVGGLEKNVLAGLDYRGVLGLAGLALLLFLEVIPFVVLAWGEARAQIAAAAAILTAVVSLAGVLREARAPVAAALLAPVAALLFAYACARSILLTYARGGIVWRGTFYPLAELRRNEV
jgi:glycosyltransferase involved in cell wall biosynthesis